MKDVWRRGKIGKADDKHFQKENGCVGSKDGGTARRNEQTEDKVKKKEGESDGDARRKKGKERFFLQIVLQMEQRHPNEEAFKILIQSTRGNIRGVENPSDQQE